MSKPNLDAFLRSGYFPKELPPALTTVGFAAAFAKGSIDEEDFRITSPDDPNRVVDPRDRRAATEPAKHFLALRSGGRRRVKILNPVSYYYLAKEIAANWTEIFAKIRRNNLSISVPESKEDSSRAATPQHPGVDRPKVRAEKFAYGDPGPKIWTTTRANAG